MSVTALTSSSRSRTSAAPRIPAGRGGGRAPPRCRSPQRESLSNQSGKRNRSGIQSARQGKTLHRVAKADLVCRVVKRQRATGTIVPEGAEGPERPAGRTRDLEHDGEPNLQSAAQLLAGHLHLRHLANRLVAQQTRLPANLVAQAGIESCQSIRGGRHAGGRRTYSAKRNAVDPAKEVEDSSGGQREAGEPPAVPSQVDTGGRVREKRSELLAGRRQCLENTVIL